MCDNKNKETMEKKITKEQRLKLSLRKAYNKWAAANPDKRRANLKRWDKKNPGKRKAIKKKYYKNNREEILKKQKIFYQKNRIEILKKIKAKREAIKK